MKRPELPRYAAVDTRLYRDDHPSGALRGMVFATAIYAIVILLVAITVVTVNIVTHY